MELNSPQKERYAKDRLRALDAQRAAEEIAFGPVIFQVSRLMCHWGLFEAISHAKDGLTIDEVAAQCKLSRYAAQILMEASLTIGTLLLQNGRFTLSKVGYFLQNSPATRVNMDFIHDVNYLGLFSLDKALQNGKPEGLKVFGSWPTIYEGLSQLPPQVQKSWFGFDHFYSDGSFKDALEIVFNQNQTRTLLDVGGNTGRWALQCVAHDPRVEVTIMDLPQQLELMRRAIANQPGADRIHGHGANLLDKQVPFPTGFDAVWMSQFLDCFSEEEVVSILSRAVKALAPGGRLYIMETFWDRQRFETTSFILTQVSVYFTALANGNSKMYYSYDMARCVEEAGLKVERYHDDLGIGGHSIMQCIKA